MAARQLFGFSVFSAAIDWADRVDHIFCGEVSAGCEDGLACGQVSNFADDLSAFGEDRRSAGAMNGAIDSASPQKR